MIRRAEAVNDKFKVTPAGELYGLHAKPPAGFS